MIGASQYDCLSTLYWPVSNIEKPLPAVFVNAIALSVVLKIKHCCTASFGLFVYKLVSIVILEFVIEAIASCHNADLKGVAIFETFLGLYKCRILVYVAASFRRYNPAIGPDVFVQPMGNEEGIIKRVSVTYKD